LAPENLALGKKRHPAGKNRKNSRLLSRNNIKKSLLLLLIILGVVLAADYSLYRQNFSGFATKVVSGKPEIDVDQVLLKVLVRSGESIERQLRITNTGDNPQKISMSIAGLGDMAAIDWSSLSLNTINPRQSKIVNIKLSSLIAQDKVRQKPGIYSGKLAVKSDTGALEIPIIIEVETPKVLLGINLNPQGYDRKVVQGSDVNFEVHLINLENKESGNVVIEYFVKGLDGKQISGQSESVVVKTQASFSKSISLPRGIPSGSYMFGATATLENSVSTASYLFDVTDTESKNQIIRVCASSPLCIGFSLGTLMLIASLIIFFYFYVRSYRGYEGESKPEDNNEKKPKELRVKKDSKSWAKSGAGIKEFLHSLGLYKTPEEKKQASLQRQIEKKIGGKSEEELKKEKEAVLKKLEERSRKSEEEFKKLEDFKEKSMQESEKKEVSFSGELKKFNEIFIRASKAVENHDASMANSLYIRARGIYVKMDHDEKQEVYDNLMKLYKQTQEVIDNQQEEEERKKEPDKKEAKKYERKKENPILSLQSENLEKFNILVRESKNSFSKGDLAQARDFYNKSRAAFLNLTYKEQGKVHEDIIGLYDKLAKK